LAEFGKKPIYDRNRLLLFDLAAPTQFEAAEKLAAHLFLGIACRGALVSKLRKISHYNREVHSNLVGIGSISMCVDVAGSSGSTTRSLPWETLLSFDAAPLPMVEIDQLHGGTH